jgi:acetoin utilization deacetylase AcuC-like enzyme
MTTSFISHPDCLKHDMGRHHPESPARLSAIFSELEERGINPKLKNYEAPLASPETLQRVHSKYYLEELWEMHVAEVHAEGRIVSTLEGGYNTSALARSVAEHIQELLKAPLYSH